MDKETTHLTKLKLMIQGIDIYQGRMHEIFP